MMTPVNRLKIRSAWISNLDFVVKSLRGDCSGYDRLCQILEIIKYEMIMVGLQDDSTLDPSLSDTSLTGASRVASQMAVHSGGVVGSLAEGGSEASTVAEQFSAQSPRFSDPRNPQ